MSYEIPSVVTLVVSQNDTQIGFINRIYKEAARIAGLPLQEQIDFANFMLKLPLSQEELDKLFDVKKEDKLFHYRIVWNKDPTPKDKTAEIQDSEFNKLRGKWFSITLNSNIKNELARRQVYYVLGGRVLGSMVERAKNDVITVPLNITFASPHFTEATARDYLKLQVQDAVTAYGNIDIKFNVTFQVGTVSAERATDGTLSRIATGTINNAVNVHLLYDNNEHRDRSWINDVSNHIFLMKSAFFKTDGMSVGALSHEIGHGFGFKGWDLARKAYSVIGNNNEVSRLLLGIFGTVDNMSDFRQIEPALAKMRSNRVQKGVDWVVDFDKAVQLRSVRADEIYGQYAYKKREPSLYDILRAGARKIVNG
jgi:hypothetical protein